MSYLAGQIHALEAYLPELTKAADFDAFWEKSIAQAMAVPMNPVFEKVDWPYRHFEVYDVSFNGFDATRIRAWLILPAFAGQERLPLMVHFHGYGGSRETPAAHMTFASLGCAVLAVDIREQSGTSGNAAAYTSGGVFAGNHTAKGILDPEEYYYRAIYMDCYKAIELGASHPRIDPERIFVRGASQGGALSVALSALSPRVKLCVCNVPSNSNIEQRVIGRHGSFTAVNDYLRRYPDDVERAFHTLSYFDTMNMAHRITARMLASVALADPVCPAKCFYATYNRVTAPKSICVYPFNEHDGAQATHIERELRFIADSGILNA